MRRSFAVLFYGAALLQAQELVTKPPLPPRVLDPISREVSEPELPMPLEIKAEVDEYENPLLIFKGQEKQALIPGEMEAVFLPLIPPVEDEMPTTGEPLTEEQQRLRDLGLKVVASVVSVRVWDEFGAQLAGGIGCFVTADGIILTDAGLIHPEIAEKVDYITVTRADGTNHKVRGFYVADLASGVALLQSENETSTPLELAPGTDFQNEQSCHVLAYSESRGLVLTDARVQIDKALTGRGWLNVRGKDSPGAVGSPVLNREGQVSALIGMQVPLKSWMNFALPVDAAAFELRKVRGKLQPLSDLPKKPKMRQVVNDLDFIAAFESLQQRGLNRALHQFMVLTQKYPRSAECWALLGLSATYLGAGPEALNCQRKATALDPKAGLYWHQLAVAKLRDSTSGDKDSSENHEALELATEQRPNDVMAWYLLAVSHLRLGKLDDSEEALKRVLLLSPDYAQAHYLTACVHGRRKEYEKAQEAVSLCLKQDTGNAEGWYFQGLLHEKAGRLQEAVEAYRKAVRLKPAHPQAGKNLAYALKKSGRNTEARQVFQEHQKQMVQRLSTAR